MATQSIASMAAVAASISSDYERLMFCRTYERMHSTEENLEFKRLIAELLRRGSGKRLQIPKRLRATPLS